MAREARGYSQAELGELVGKAQTAISSWERNRTTPTREDVQRVADKLRVPASDIEGKDGSAYQAPTFREVPVISWVSAGRLTDPGELTTMTGDKLMIADLPNAEYFATVVRGDSMDRISPEDSRIIVNASDRDPRPGRYYLFSLRGEATYKRFANDPVVRLEPYSTNPANPIIFPKADKDWSVIGRVVRSYIDLG